MSLAIAPVASSDPVIGLVPEPSEFFDLNGVRFGDTGHIIVESFSPGTASVRSQAVDDPRGDSRRFGREYKTPATWNWSLGINREDQAGALETLDTLQGAWDNTTDRQQPGTVKTLRYSVGGRVRRVYGRPGRCEEVLDVRRKSGYIGVEADFQRADLLHYDDVPRSRTLSIVPATTGGLVSPLKSPLRSLSSPDVQSAGLITVGGTADTWAIVSFKGATGSSDLRVEVAGWSVGVDGNIAEGEVITINGYPWVRTALSSFGGSASGRLMPDSRLGLMLLSPGQHEIRFSGSDLTGTSTVTVLWHEASRSF